MTANPGECTVPQLCKTARVIGHRLLLRDAGVSDAPFIYSLRSDPVRARYLSAVPEGVEHQRRWLTRYSKDDRQAYFVIVDRVADEPLGTVRLYGARGCSFSWGSWLLKPGLPARCAIESALIVYRYARWLGFRSAYFEVVQDNVSVWRFHENFGARRVGRSNGQFQYELSEEALDASLHKYRRYLPNGIQVQP